MIDQHGSQAFRSIGPFPLVEAPKLVTNRYSLALTTVLLTIAFVPAASAQLPPGHAEVHYNRVTGELFFKLGPGINVVGLATAVDAFDPSATPGLIGSDPALQYDSRNIGYFNSNGLAPSTAEQPFGWPLGPVLEPNLAAEDFLGFSLVPAAGITGHAASFIFPEPASVVLLGLALGAAILAPRRRCS